MLNDLEEGFPVLLQSAGIGPIRPNIALFNWFDREETAEDAPAMRSFGAFLRTALRHGCSVGLLAAHHDALQGLSAASEGERVLDVWWHEGDASSKLALLLAYLTSRRAPWDGAQLRLLAPRVPGKSDEDLLAELEAVLEAVRIRAQAVVVPDTSWATVAAQSAGTSLAYRTFRVRSQGLCDADGELLPGSLEGLPPMVFVQAESDIDLEAQPDQGVQAEQARREDALIDTLARSEHLRAEAEAERAEARAAAERLAEVQADPDRSADLEALQKEAEQRTAAAATAERKAAKAAVKLQALEAERDPDPGAAAEAAE